MSNKQSSIDTAIEQIYQKILDSKNPNATTKRGGDYRIGLRAAIDILEELKEMHKQEQKIAYESGFENSEYDQYEDCYELKPNFEDWYEKIFGGKDEQ